MSSCQLLQSGNNARVRASENLAELSPTWHDPLHCVKVPVPVPKAHGRTNACIVAHEVLIVLRGIEYAFTCIAGNCLQPAIQLFVQWIPARVVEDLPRFWRLRQHRLPTSTTLREVQRHIPVAVPLQKVVRAHVGHDVGHLRGCIVLQRLHELLPLGKTSHMNAIQQEFSLFDSVGFNQQPWYAAVRSRGVALLRRQLANLGEIGHSEDFCQLATCGRAPAFVRGMLLPAGLLVERECQSTTLAAAVQPGEFIRQLGRRHALTVDR
mmetsp:Transcript_1105/g.2613  ORF Transcript_1105/g.2613 Transcript_1105/m.2613 type:complete len:266 (+) Transcript_1105:544-1341(+)